jgi:predicted O-methyltransferase YrrM
VLARRIALFQWRAYRMARALGDEFALRSATRPHDVATLLRLAEGRRRVAELGTATGWTTAALALADPGRKVISFDPVVQDHRDAYLGLLPDDVRAQIELHALPGDEGAALVDEPVDLLFVDSTHDREGTVAEVTAWRPKLADDALVVLHDYGHPAYPGVAEAVSDLGLEGDVRGGCFVARHGAPPAELR